MNRSSIRPVLALFAGLAIALLLAACGGNGNASTTDGPFSDDATEVERLLLTSTEPDVSPGHLLELSRVVIPAGEQIPAHTHPGPQLAVIVSGNLTYTIIEGEAEVTRDSGSADPTVETYGGGETVVLNPGDTVTEPEGMVHRAENAGDTPVVIFLSTLFLEGEPAASPVD